MPTDHGGGLDDQHHRSETGPVERTRQQREDGPVRRREPGPIDLPLQNAQLMAKGEDLGVTLVT